MICLLVSVPLCLLLGRKLYLGDHECYPPVKCKSIPQSSCTVSERGDPPLILTGHSAVYIVGGAGECIHHAALCWIVGLVRGEGGGGGGNRAPHSPHIRRAGPQEAGTQQ